MLDRERLGKTVEAPPFEPLDNDRPFRTRFAVWLNGPIIDQAKMFSRQFIIPNAKQAAVGQDTFAPSQQTLCGFHLIFTQRGKRAGREGKLLVSRDLTQRLTPTNFSDL